MADEIASLILRVDSTQANTAGTELDKLTAAGERAEAAVQGVGSASRAAGGGVGAFGQAARTATAQAAAASLSAGQLSNAMRMLPAQITDITVGLSTGQSPFMVLLQQGGQLKDIFGGIGPAIRATVGYVAGLVTPISAVGAAVAALGVAYYSGTEETDRFNEAIALTGNAAGVTAGQLTVMAQEIGQTVGTTGKAADALAKLVETGQFAGDTLKQLAAAALAMEQATGRSVEETVKAYQKIADEPAKALAELNKQQNFLTASQYEQIQALEREGDKREAARFAVLAYADASRQTAATVVDRAGAIESAWDAVWRAVRRAGSALADIGRDTGMQGELIAAEQRLVQLQDEAYQRGAARRVAQVEEQRKVVADLRDRLRMQERLAANEREQAQITQASIEAQQAIDKARESSATQQQRLNKALAEYRSNIEAIRRADPNSAYLNAARIAADEAAIRKQFEDRGAGSRGSLSAAARMIQQAREQEASLRAQLDSAVKITSARQALVQFEQRIADIKAKDQRNADEQSLLANEQAIRAQLQTNAALSDQVALQKEAVQLRVAERSALETLAADQERYADMLETFAAGPRLREQIEAQRELYRDFQRQAQRAAEQQAAGDLTAQGYADRLRVLRQSLNDRLALQAAAYKRLRELEADWRNGAKSGLAEYSDEVANVARATHSAFYDAFRGAEDALVQFVTTGKLSFSDLANSIIADLARIAIRQSITGPLAGALGSALSGFFGPSVPETASWAMPEIAGGRASGGPTLPGRLYEVNERGPELYTANGRTFLMSGADGGYVTPVTSGLMSGAPAAPAAPQLQINLVNQSSQPVEATGNAPRFDGEQFVVDVVLKDFRRNGPISQQMRNQ